MTEIQKMFINIAFRVATRETRGIFIVTFLNIVRYIVVIILLNIVVVILLNIVV